MRFWGALGGGGVCVQPNPTPRFFQTTRRVPPLSLALEAADGEESAHLATSLESSPSWAAWLDALLEYAVLLPRDPDAPAPEPIRLVQLQLSPFERARYNELHRRARMDAGPGRQLAWIPRLRRACVGFAGEEDEEETEELDATLPATPQEEDALLWPRLGTWAGPRPPPPLSTKMAYILRYERESMLAGEKMLVMCETLQPLYELAEHLRLREISHSILCGTTQTGTRREIIAAVGSAASPHPRITLMPLLLCPGLDGFQGAGDGGGANHLIYLDGYWGPMPERQGLGRLKRPGQSREVRFCVCVSA